MNHKDKLKLAAESGQPILPYQDKLFNAGNLYSLIALNPCKSIKDYAKSLGCSKETTRKLLKELLENNKITKITTMAGTHERYSYQICN